MFLGAGEIVVVLAVALMVLGPKKMPEVARNLARFVAQLRRMADDVRSQVDDALQEPPKSLQSPPPEPHQSAPAIEPHHAPPAADGAGGAEQSLEDNAAVHSDGPPPARPPQAS